MSWDCEICGSNQGRDCDDNENRALHAAHRVREEYEEFIVEYERLKKEFEDYKKVAGLVQFIDEFHRGVAEGERRAMERLKEAISKQIGSDRERFYIIDAVVLEKELGIGEEVRE